MSDNYTLEFEIEGSNTITEAGSYQVRLYLDDGSQDTPSIGLPDKNVDYTLHAHNHLERIRYKLQKKAEQGVSGGNPKILVVNIEHQSGSGEMLLDRNFKEINDVITSGGFVVGRDATQDGIEEYWLSGIGKGTDDSIFVNFVHVDSLNNVTTFTFESDSDTGLLATQSTVL